MGADRIQETCRSCGGKITEADRADPDFSRKDLPDRCRSCRRLPPGWIVFLIVGALLLLVWFLMR